MLKISYALWQILKYSMNNSFNWWRDRIKHKPKLRSHCRPKNKSDTESIFPQCLKYRTYTAEITLATSLS